MKSSRIWTAAAFLLLSGCSGTLPPVTKPRPVPEALLQCPAWPRLEGDGRVDLTVVANAVAEAKANYLDCQRRLDAARGYIRDLNQ